MVEITYRNQQITSLGNSGTKTLKTSGKRCDADIIIAYVVRCPRGDADGGMEMDDYYAYFLPFCEAKDVTKQEE